MNQYLLNNYSLTKRELFQSIFVSEYGLRHLAQSKIDPRQKWGHRIIAVIELCPLIGAVTSLIEAIFAKFISTSSKNLSEVISQKIITTPFVKESSLKISNHQEILKKEVSLPEAALNKEYIFEGVNGRGTNGDISISKVEYILAALSSKPTPGIKFNRTRLFEYLEGGTCSALSLEFLVTYFKIKKLSNEQKKDSITKSELLLDSMKNVAHKFFSSSIEMRNIQAAFNTIEVQLQKEEVDYKRNKIQSLANYHSLVIDYTSKEVDVDNITDEREVSDEVKSLPLGAYILRIIKPLNNEKLEEHGHTMVYIKDKEVSLFYDPNKGLKKLTPFSDHANTIFQNFQECLKKYEVSKARFYRIQNTIPL